MFVIIAVTGMSIDTYDGQLFSACSGTAVVPEIHG